MYTLIVSAAISIPEVLFIDAAISFPPSCFPLFSSPFSSNKAIHCLFSRAAFIHLHKWLGVPRLFAGKKGKPYAKKFIHQGRTSSPSGRLCDRKDRGKLARIGCMADIQGTSFGFILIAASGIISRIIRGCCGSRNSYTDVISLRILCWSGKNLAHGNLSRFSPTQHPIKMPECVLNNSLFRHDTNWEFHSYPENIDSPLKIVPRSLRRNTFEQVRASLRNWIKSPILYQPLNSFLEKGERRLDVS